MGRDVQRAYGQVPQAVMTHPLLVGTDGKEKMSKSLGNTIEIQDPPDEMYGKTMRVSDDLMLVYYDLLRVGDWSEMSARRVALAEGREDPMGFKKALAANLVARFHGEDAARLAAEHFRKVVQNKENPEEVEETHFALGGREYAGVLELLAETGLVASRGEARRLIAAGAVKLDGKKVENVGLQLPVGTYLVQAGKRKFRRIKIDENG
jgi:tyrosyl-tRNA synthetase